MFKIGSKVFYPSHGAGWVKAEKEIEFNGQKKEYFEFEFVNNALTISTPIENLERLGIRQVLTAKEIKQKVEILKKKPTKDPKTVDFNKLMELFKSLEGKADIDNAIQTIQYCNFIKKQREKDGRLIPVTIENELGRAMADIIGELAVSSGITLENAAKNFEKITGLESKLPY